MQEPTPRRARERNPFALTSTLYWASVAAIVATLLLATRPATGGTAELLPCWSRDGLAAFYDATRGQQPAGRALTHVGGLLEVLVGPDGRWTMILTAPDGCALVVGLGRAWEAWQPAPAAGPPAGPHD